MTPGWNPGPPTPARARSAVAAVLTLLLLAGPTGAAIPSSDAPGVEPPGENGTDGRLYVANQSAAAVTVIDTVTDEVVEVVDLTELGFTPNAKPHDTAVEADGAHWYVSLIADGFVLKFDRDNELVGRAAFETPGLLALDPRRDVLYVGRSMAAVNPPQRIGWIRRSGMELEEIGVFFPRPHALAAGPGGGLVYTASLAENRLAAVRPDEEAVELLEVPGDTHAFVHFAVSPDGATLVTGGQVSGELMAFDIGDPMAPELRHSASLGGEPWHPTFSADGELVYFPRRTADSVAVVDTGSWEVIDEVEHPALAEPHGSALSADGSTLYVSSRNTGGTYTPHHAPEGDWEGPPGTVVAIDTATLEVETVLAVPPYAAGISTRARH